MTLISILLFDTVSGATPRRFAEWLTPKLPNQEACAAAAGQTFLGLYETSIDLYPGARHQANSIGGRCAMIHVAHATSVEHALQREVASVTAVDPAFHGNRQGWIDPASARRLWLVPICRSSFAATAMRLDDKLLHIAMRYLPSHHTIDELIAFSERIVQPYAEIMAGAKWFHMGSLHVIGLTQYMYADAMDVVEAASVEEALANDEALPMTEHYRAIQRECVEYMDQTRERFAMWMKPLVLGAAARKGVRFD